jgi:hypothetical protein
VPGQILWSMSTRSLPAILAGRSSISSISNLSLTLAPPPDLAHHQAPQQGTTSKPKTRSWTAPIWYVRRTKCGTTASWTPIAHFEYKQGESHTTQEKSIAVKGAKPQGISKSGGEGTNRLKRSKKGLEGWVHTSVMVVWHHKVSWG